MAIELTRLEKERLLKLAGGLGLKGGGTSLPPIMPVAREETLPLSFAQQRLWFLAQLAGGSDAYHIAFRHRLRGALATRALRCALDRIVARHEALRTTFIVVDGEPRQRIAPAAESRFDLIEEDWRGRTDTDVALADAIAAEHSRPFDLERGALIRGRLIRLGDQEHVFLITMHHIVADGWSIGLLATELGALYAAFVQDGEDPLPPLTIQYADYAAWQRRWISSTVAQQHDAYWKHALAGAAPRIALPTDHRRPEQADFAGGWVNVSFSERLTAGLRKLGRRHGATLYMTVLAGWAALLSRLTGQTDLVIGSPAANRELVEIEGLIGFFINSLPLRVDVSGSPTVAELLERVKAQVLAAQDHQDVPFEHIVEIVQPSRSAAHNPLFQVMFAADRVRDAAFLLPGVATEPLPPSPHRTAKFDLMLLLQEGARAIGGGLEYATALFTHATAERHVRYLRRLLEGMVLDAVQPIDRIGILSPAERKQLVAVGSKTREAYPLDTCLHELLERQARETPDAVAVTCEDASLTYRELHDRAGRVAARLRALGIRPDARVAIDVERSLELVIGLYGIVKAGGAYVPLDRTYPAERLQFMLTDSAPVAVVTCGAGVDSASGAPLPVVDLAAPTSASDVTPEDAHARARAGLTPDHLAYVIYTSGSTGRPKGAMVAQRGVVNRLLWMQRAYQLTPGDAVLQKTPSSFDVSVWEFFWPLAVGARLVMARPEGHKDPGYLVDAIERHGITTLHFVPSMLQTFLDHVAVGSCQALQRIICSGEALAARLVAQSRARLPHASVHNLYGPTEATVDVTAWSCVADAVAASVPIGRPIANVQIYLLDRHGSPVPAGVAGELHIGGVQVARGYWERPELTAERFVADRFGEPGGRLYRTGDLARWLPDGAIEFLGRNDQQVKIRGQRIELEEIEARLCAHPSIAGAVVMTCADPAGEPQLVAYFTCGHAGDEIGASALREHLGVTLPDYMVPAAYVRLAQLPLTPSGKVDRRALPNPDQAAFAVASYEAPIGEVESAIAASWATVLRRDRIGRQDNFFALGGHSLLAVRVVTELRRVGIRMDVSSLFVAPTLAALAAVIDPRPVSIDVPPNAIPEATDAIAPEMLPLVTLTAEEIARIVAEVPGGAVNVQDIYPLAPLQEGILFHALMSGDGDPYLLGSLYSFDSRQQLDAYLHSLQTVIARHDILRTAVIWEGVSEPVQVVWRTASLPTEEVTFDAQAGDVATQLYARCDPRHFRLDVRRAPLLHAVVARDGANDRWLLMQLVHHLVGDHVTIEVMHDEIAACLNGEEARLPVPLPFRTLVAQARLGIGQSEHEAYFRRLLGDVAQPTAPFGLLNVRGDGTGIDEARVQVDGNVARRLRSQAGRLGVSVASVVHVAWAQVLARVATRDDVVFGTVLFGRMLGESERVLGLLINTLPVRVRIGELSAVDAVRGVHDQLAETLRHEHAPLALAQRCSAVPAPAPLFSSLLNYRHSKRIGRKKHSPWEGIRRLRGDVRTSYPLMFAVDDFGDGFQLTAQVEHPVGAERVCEYMHIALTSLVDALEHRRHVRAHILDVLPAAERNQLLQTGRVAHDVPPDTECLATIFERHVRLTPDAPAVACEETTVTYGALNRRANQVAHRLRALGVGPDVRVALCAERGVEAIVGLLAVLKAGGAYVPLDPTYPEARLRGMVLDSAPVTVLASAQTKARCAAVAPSLPLVDLTEAIDWCEQPTRNLDRAALGVTPDHLAYVIYTSGSTGTPKGVMVSQRAVAQYVAAIEGTLGLSPGATCGWVSTVAADLGHTMLFPALLGGGVLHVVPASVTTDSRRFAAYRRAHQCEYLKITPSHFHALLSDGHTPDAIPARGLVFGGEVLSPALVASIAEQRPECQIYNHYGPTECTVGALADLVVDTAPAHGRVPLGRPLGAARITILDRAGQLVPVGVAGEICIGGSGVARGYLRRADVTAERFVPDPFAAGGARMYRTGDVGQWRSDGRVDFLGRADRQVKIRGHRIELAEVEAQLRAHAAVRDVVVVVREEADGESRLVAYFTDGQAEGSAAIQGDALRAQLLSVLPDYMVPAAYVRLAAFPVTANGKVDRRQLPAPETEAAPGDSYEEPVGEIERVVARVWADVLKRERVSRRDNFFELGGHSLLAVRVMARLRQAGIHADIGALFATPTLADFSGALDQAATRVAVPPNGIPVGCDAITPAMLPLVSLTEQEIARVVATVPGGAANVQDIYPLAPLQEGILFHALMSGDGDPYVLGSLYSFDSRARVDAYVSALQAVIARHDILRTAFLWEGVSEPVQVVWRHAVLPVEAVELEAGTADGASELFARYDPRRQGLDLQRAPLMRLAIAWDAVHERWLLMHMQHHLIGDHVTTDAVDDEVQAHLRGEEARLPAPRPFRNMVAQARLGVSAAAHETYFRQLVGDVTEPTAPFGLLDVRGAAGTLEMARVRLPAELSARLRAQARALQVSAASLCHVAWGQVLARIAGRTDVVFGTVVFGRLQGDEGAEQAFGLFMNTLPVRLRIDAANAAETVRAMHAQLAALLRHEHAPLALAQRCSAVPAPTPLFSSLLNYRYGRQVDATARPAPRIIEGMRWLRGLARTNYPVVLSVDDLGEHFHVTAQVGSAATASRVVAYMQTALTALVEALSDPPSRPLGALDVLPPPERQQVLVDWNATEAAYPDTECLPALFEAAARATPDAVAVVCDEESVTYRALHAEVAQLAERLRVLGVEPDTPVAISVERSLDLLIGVLGILSAGGAYLPLDLSYPLARLEAIVSDSAVVALLTRGPLPAAAQPLAARVPIVDLASDWRGPARDAGVAPPWMRNGLTPEHLAYVIYTSGSTGQPKGVMVAQRSVVNQLTWMQRSYGLGPGDTVLQKTPITFDVSVWELIWPVLAGARLVMARPDGHKDPAYLCDTIARYGVTTLHFVPSMFELFLAEPAVASCQTLVRIICAGESLRPALVEQCAERLPRTVVDNLYGPTEGAVAVTGWTGTMPVGSTSVPIGRPIGNVQIYILDRQRAPTPVDVPGELYIGGVQVARGYLRRPSLTAERFVSDPFGPLPGGRLYRTGDLARWQADGTIEFLGRTDFQVKLRGQRIELEEIDAQLRRHAAVQSAVVVARDVGGDTRLVAYYTAHEPASAGDAETLRGHLAASLPEYMVPAAYVQLETLPMTPSGKLDRGALPAPDAAAYSAPAYEPPIGPIETTLATIWAEVLHVARVGRHDNFFALGGHSLLAVRVMARVRQAGVPVDVRALFATPTVAALAAAIEPQRGRLNVPPNGIPDGCIAITPAMLPLVSLTAEDITRIVESVPGGAANIQDIYPLVPLQEGILFHTLLEGASDPYVVARLIGFDTRARLDAYLAALQAVIVRHDILRTAVVWEGLREPVQVVWRRASLPIDEVTLEDETGDVVRALSTRCDPRHVRLDVRQAPLLHVAIAHDPAQGRWLLMQRLHHLAGDQVTMDVMQEEVAALQDGGAARLPAPQPFRNLVAQAHLGGGAVEHEEYFRHLLGDVTEPTAPFGLIDVHGDGSAINEAQLTMPPDLARRLRAQARALGVSAASLFHVAWAQVLARVSGRSDVVFGTVLFGRMELGEERTLGLFINTLPVRLRIEEAGAASVVRAMHGQLAALLNHEHAPLALAQRCSAVPAPAPLFSSILNYRHRQRRPASPHGLASPHVLWSEGRTNYPITLSIDDRDDALRVTAQVQGPVTAHRIVTYMQTALTALVEALAQAPNRPVRALEVLPAPERQQVVADWNATDATYPETQCLPALFEAAARATPDGIALVCDDQCLTYRTLQAEASQLAERLCELGVRPDTLVAIGVERSLDLLIGVLGILSAGGAYLPLDLSYPLARLEAIAADSAAVALLTRGPLPAGLQPLAARVPIVDLAGDWRGPARDAGVAPAWMRSGLTPEHLAYVIYTSGSTGHPKGVMVAQRSVVNRLTWMQRSYGLAPGDTVLQKTPITFDVSVWELFWPALVGARLVMARPEGHKDPAYLCDTIVRYGVTTMHFVPSMFELFLAEPAAARCTPLMRIVCSGEALPDRFVEQSQARLPQAAVHNLYGPTEAAVDVTAWTGRADEAGASSVPIGRPMANVQIYILDRYWAPTPVDVPGELYIGGVQVARGYLHRPPLTAERFVADPFGRRPGDRLYRTGDVARWRADGTIEFLGRTDFQVKLRGQRIELEEIEAQLRRHAAVQSAVVVARDVGGDTRLVAYYTTHEPANSEDAEALRAHLAATLPEYMVPAAYVRLESVPITPSGKLDRRALPAPDVTAYSAPAYESPIGEIETTVATIWADVLHVARVGRHDNFFALGGHSLLAVRVMARVRQAGVPVDVRALFATPTVAALAAAIEPPQARVTVPPTGIPPGCTAITPAMLLPLVALTAEDIARIVESVPGGAANIQDIYPLAPLQEGILFHTLLDSESDPYLLAALISFDTRARLDAYVAALQAVMTRHDILRTAVVWEGLREPVQVVWRRALLPIDEVTLEDETGDAARALYARYDPQRVRLDVRQAPLLHVAIARDPARNHWLLMQRIHHLAGDHVTLEVLDDEIAAILRGAAAELPAPQPFRNLVAQARLGGSAAEHEAYFQQLLGDVTEPTAPFGLLDVRGDGSTIDEAHLTVPLDVARRLRARARGLGVSAASVFHVAWAQVLARVSGRADVVFGTVLFGRMALGEERTLGLFMNTLPVRLHVGAGATPLVRHTHEQLAALLQHEHAPLASAQRCSAVPAPLPLFSSLLNFRHRSQVNASSPRVREGMRGIRSEERTNYPVVLSVDDYTHGFKLKVQVAAPGVASRVVAYMETALTALVAALESAPERPVAGLEVLPEPERQQVLAAWNATAAAYPDTACLPALVEAVAHATPDAVAAVCDEASLTYAALNRQANQVAHALRAQGVTSGVRVAVAVARGLDLLVAVLAVWKSGGVYVPLDPTYPQARLQDMLEDSAPAVLVTSGESPVGAGARWPVLDLQRRAAWQVQPATDLAWPARRSSRELAYIIYTSGSTGRPKGAMVEHRGMVNHLYTKVRDLGLRADDRVAQTASPSFDISVWQCLAPLVVGGTTVIVSDRDVRDPAALAATLARAGVTVFETVPIMLEALTDREAAGALPSLRWALVTGEACASPLCRRWLAQHPAIPLVNAYGPTECSDDVTHHVMAEPPAATLPVAPIGRPVANTRLYVLNAARAPVPAGVAGELYVGGDGVGRGYWQRAAVTAERFVPDGCGPVPGARLYRTGDLARYTDDGVLEFLGRVDTQVKVRGYRIELEEIEARLRTHPAVHHVVVLAREQPDGDRRLVAYYTSHASAAAAAETEHLRAHLAATLPDYMVPVAYVRLTALPVTANGKLDRKALPAPDEAAYATGGYEAPAGPIEIALAAIWAEVLDLDRVGRHDNFFRLGGHSLLAMTLVERMRQHGFAVDVGRLFMRPTIAALSVALDTAVDVVNVPENRIPEIRTAALGASHIEVRI